MKRNEVLEPEVAAHVDELVKGNSVQADEFLSDVDSAAIDTMETVAKEVITEAQAISELWTRPSVVYRAVLSKTATAWKVKYGDFVAFGATPNIAMRNFDQAWYNRGLEVSGQ